MRSSLLEAQGTKQCCSLGSVCENIHYRDSYEDWHNSSPSLACHRKLLCIGILKCAPQMSLWSFQDHLMCQKCHWLNKQKNEGLYWWVGPVCIALLSLASGNSMVLFFTGQDDSNTAQGRVLPMAAAAFPFYQHRPRCHYQSAAYGGRRCHSCRWTGSWAGLPWQQLDVADAVWMVPHGSSESMVVPAKPDRPMTQMNGWVYKRLFSRDLQAVVMKMKHWAAFCRDVLPLL